MKRLATGILAGTASLALAVTALPASAQESTPLQAEKQQAQRSDNRPGPLTATRRIVRPDGQGVPVQVTSSLVRDSGGAPLHWLCQCAPKLLSGVQAISQTEPLSYRERQVLGLLAQGHDGPAIAERLGLSPETVRSYSQSARDKLGAKTRTEAVALAVARGEISL